MKRKSIIQVYTCIFAMLFMLSHSLLAETYKTKVACIGNSITEGSGLSDPKTQSYPPQMQTMLGDTFEVLNFGVSARTMLKNGDYPYWNEVQYTNALAYNPDFVIIKLGTNDSKSFQWPQHKDEYPLDYKEMIHNFQSLPSHPEIILCLLIPGQNESWQIWDSVMRDEVNPVIRQIALDEGLSLIDLYTVFENGSPDWILTDGVHPTQAGSAVIAENVKDMILMAKPEIAYTDHKLIAPDGDAYQWYYNGELISEADGGTSKELTPDGSGKYKVSVKLTADSETRIVSEEYNLNYLSGDYKITAKHSLMNLGIEGNSTAYGALVQQFPNDTVSSQVWTITKIDSAYYTFTNKKSLKRLSIEHSSILADANIVQYDGILLDTTQWSINYEDNGFYSITNKVTKFALTLLNGSDTAGAQLIQDTLKYTDNQLFLISAKQDSKSSFYGAAFEAPSIFEAEDFDLGGEGISYHTIGAYVPGNYRPNESITITSCSNCSSYSVSDISAGEWVEYTINITDTTALIGDLRISSVVVGSKLQILVDEVDITGSSAITVTGNNDTWTSFNFPLKAASGNHIMRIACTEGSFNLDRIAISKNLESSSLITLNANGKVISVSENSTSEGAVLIQTSPSGANGQQWKIDYARDGYYKFENINSGLVMTVVNDTIVQSAFSDMDSQLWQFVPNGKGYYTIRNLENGKFVQPSEYLPTEGLILVTRSMISNGNLNVFFSALPFEREPFNGTAVSIPAAIEAENYDLGGEGVGYHELDGLYTFGLYRKSESVDLEVCNEGGYDISNIKAGEWLKYSIYADSTTVYTFTFKTARSKAIIRVGMDDVDSVSTVTVPSTGSALVWKTESIDIPLTKGDHILKTTFTVGNINVDKIIVSYASSTGLQVNRIQSLLLYPNPVSDGFVTLHLPVKKGNSNELRITDISGKVIYSKQNCETVESIDFSIYSNGLYFVKFSNGNESFISKIIKK